MQEGLVRIAGIAWAQADAKHYLVNRLTKQIKVIVDGEHRALRLVGDRGSFSRPARITVGKNAINSSQRSAVYKLEFWDGAHGLNLCDSIVAELQSEPSDRAVSVLEGVVTSVQEQKVSVTGNDYFDAKSNR